MFDKIQMILMMKTSFQTTVNRDWKKKKTKTSTKGISENHGKLKGNSKNFFAKYCEEPKWQKITSNDIFQRVLFSNLWPNLLARKFHRIKVKNIKIHNFLPPSGGSQRAKLIEKWGKLWRTHGTVAKRLLVFGVHGWWCTTSKLKDVYENFGGGICQKFVSFVGISF